MLPAFRWSFSHCPASLPPARLSVATTDDLPSQSGMSLSTSTTLIPLSTAFCSSPLTFGLVGVMAIAFTPCDDHGLDERDLAFVVGAALALAEDDLDVGVVLVPRLHGVDHRVVEVDRELRDEPDLDGLAGGRGPGSAGCGRRGRASTAGGGRPAGAVAVAAAAGGDERSGHRATATNRLVLMLSPFGVASGDVPARCAGRWWRQPPTISETIRCWLSRWGPLRRPCGRAA